MTTTLITGTRTTTRTTFMGIGEWGPVFASNKTGWPRWSRTLSSLQDDAYMMPGVVRRSHDARKIIKRNMQLI